jgi:two-component system alkaline phosphatase synthesis response regulator PhoP
MMPKMDGIEACRIMRTMPEFKNTFMVFLQPAAKSTAKLQALTLALMII